MPLDFINDGVGFNEIADDGTLGSELLTITKRKTIDSVNYDCAVFVYPKPRAVYKYAGMKDINGNDIQELRGVMYDFDVKIAFTQEIYAYHIWQELPLNRDIYFKPFLDGSWAIRCSVIPDEDRDFFGDGKSFTGETFTIKIIGKTQQISRPLVPLETEGLGNDALGNLDLGF